MKYFSLICLTVAAVLLQGSDADAKIVERDGGSLLDGVFDNIRLNLKIYVKDETYGNNLMTFFEEMKKDMSGMTMDRLNDDLSGKSSLLDDVWKNIIKSATVAFQGTKMSDKAIETFLKELKSRANLIDLLHMVAGPFDNVFQKVRDSIDATVKVVDVKPGEVDKFKSLIAAIEKGLKERPPQ